MTARTVATFVAIWLGFALLGGLIDGQILGTGEQTALSAAMQPDAITESGSGILGQAQSWFSATLGFLTGWASMLALNFSFFSDGGIGTIVGWGVRAIIGLPMITMLLIQIFGR